MQADHTVYSIKFIKIKISQKQKKKFNLIVLLSLLKCCYPFIAVVNSILVARCKHFQLVTEMQI
jgi:hypothetical protein